MDDRWSHRAVIRRLWTVRKRLLVRQVWVSHRDGERDCQATGAAYAKAQCLRIPQMNVSWDTLSSLLDFCGLCTFGSTSSDTALIKQDSGPLCSIFRNSVGALTVGTEFSQHWGNEQPGHSELLESVTQGRFVCRQEVWILSQLKGKLRIIRHGGLKFSIWSSYSLFSVVLYGHIRQEWILFKRLRMGWLLVKIESSKSLWTLKKEKTYFPESWFLIPFSGGKNQGSWEKW